MPVSAETNMNSASEDSNKLSTSSESSNGKKQPFIADGVTGFIESLIRKNIVTRENVNGAVAFK